MADNNINGIINVYKEKGYTSHDVVAKLRGILKTKKIGHTGTLDPDAEGVLPVCVGNATKLCDVLLEKNKTYKAELILGIDTDTQDISGKVTNKNEDLSSISEKSIIEVIDKYIGEYSQIPPMYSALKVNGKKLYELAREGIEIERQPRNVYIYDINVININIPYISMEVTCSKGTYIRTLCHDIGRDLGVGGCMSKLVRTRTGGFDISLSKKLGEIEQIRDNGKLFDSGIILTTEKALDYCKSYIVKENWDKLLTNGNILYDDAFCTDEKDDKEEKINDSEYIKVYNSKGRFMALYQYDNRICGYKPFKMFL